MAMRRLVQYSYGFERKLVNLFGKATIGSSGAITISKDINTSLGIKSIVKLATAGQYRITLEDSYYQLLDIGMRVQNATGIAASGSLALVATGTNTQASGGGTIIIQMSNAGAATNLASGDVVYFNIQLGDSKL